MTVFAWFVVGVLTTGAGLLGGLRQELAILLLPAVLLTVLTGARATYQLWRDERLLVQLAIMIWLLHAVQLVVPETGFDALWYHLPVAELALQNHGFVYDPTLYQSVNPLFSDSIFFLGYFWAGAAGAKLVAYCFGILLAGATYALSRVVLSKKYALWTVMLVSLLQVVAWQSSSFYVDVAKAFWEVAAIWVIVTESRWRTAAVSSGLLFGAAVATKLFAIVLLPVFVVLWMVRERRNALLPVSLAVAAAVLVALPFYWFTWQHTGTPFFSLGLHLSAVAQEAGQGSSLTYLQERLAALPLLPLQLITARDYLTPLTWLGVLSLLGMAAKWKTLSTTWRILAVFTAAQLAVWWFVPPLSTRYALSGWVVLTVLGMACLAAVEKLFNERLHSKYRPVARWFFPGVLTAVVIMLLIPRLLVLKRSWPVVTGTQTPPQYLHQFLDGNSDHVLYSWYGKNLDQIR